MMKATKEMCVYCFDELLSNFDESHLRKIKLVPQEWEEEKLPLFVTWKTLNGKLRGCIGTFKSAPLEQNLKIYSLAAALRDSRFKSIQMKEIPNLKCEVNLLVNFEEALDVYDWEIGTHGVIVKFDGKRSTYLPSVAKETGFTKKEIINKLIKKAGYTGDPKNVIDKVNVTRYESTLFEITYMDYLSYNVQQQMYVHEKYLLRWKLPFKFQKQTKDGKVYMLSERMNVRVGQHNYEGREFSSLTLDLISNNLEKYHLVLFFDTMIDIKSFNKDFVNRMLDEQKEMKDITVMFPKMCWGFYNTWFNVKVLCFNAFGISKKPIPTNDFKINQVADINILSDFTVVIVKEDGTPEVRGIVLDIFNPWKSEKQRKAIWAKRNKSKGKKRKYYDRMIRRWDKHSKKI
jgi:uncharacterized protein (TIGR00296 family)